LCIICGPRIALRPLSGAYKLHRVQRLGDEVSPISIYKFYVIGVRVVARAPRRRLGASSTRFVSAATSMTKDDEHDGGVMITRG
jgi:hypothetical protein